MLSLIYGPSKSGKTEYIFKLLKDKAKLKEETLLFVPEQFSFENERKLLEILGNSDAIFAPVLSFSRLCDEIKRIYGGSAGTVIDEGLRLLILTKTLKSLKGELKYFKTSTANTVDTVNSVITEIKHSCVNSEMLLEVSKKAPNTVLSDKLNDLALIISTYNAICVNAYIDPIDDLTFAYRKITDNNYFKGKTVIFDGFSSFSAQQYNIIRAAVCQAERVIVSLCSDGKTDDKYGMFSNVNRTALKLCSIAKNENVGITEPIVLTDSHFNNDSLSNIYGVFSHDREVPDKIAEGINIYALSSKQEECEFAAEYIHSKVRLNNLRYRDFVFIVRDKSDYSDFVKPIFEKHEVPIYINDKHRFSESALSSFVLSALRASRSYKTEEIMNMLKCGLTDIDDSSVFDIDNYVYLWSINNQQWDEDWQFNPFGLQELDGKRAERAKDILEGLNKLREQTVAPIKKLHSMKNASAFEFSKAVFELLEKTNTSKHLSEITDKLISDGMHDEAEFQASCWDALIKILDNIVEVFSDESMSFTEYYNLLYGSFSKTEIGGIPQGLDEVIFTSPDKLSTFNVKHAVIAGMNYGVFPCFSGKNSLFTSGEIAFLKSCNIDFEDNALSDAIEENFIAYRALTSPSDSLTLLYHLCDYSSGKCDISPLLLEISEQFGIGIKAVGTSCTIETKAQAFSVATANMDNLELHDSIFRQLSSYPQFSAKINAINGIKNKAQPKLSREISTNLFGKDLKTSPSRIEYYYQCPYAFYCKYGLNIKNREKIDFKIMQRGTVAHYVLEKILQSEIISEPENSADKIPQFIDKYITEYIDNTVGSINFLDKQSLFLLSRIKDMLIDIVAYIQSEIVSSGFKPVAFELNLSSDGDIPPLKIEDNEGRVTLNGKIDRVDRAEIGGKSYVRIIDYKTGRKDFALSDVLSGLNLQMLIYLCALCESSPDTVYPAGVLYQPVNHISRTGTSRIVDSQTNPKAKGILTADRAVLSVMDPDAKFMPFSIKKDGELSKSSSCITEDDFKTVFDYIKKSVSSMHINLMDGNISISPCANDNSKKTCEYCDYKEICRYIPENKSLDKYSNDETLRIMKEGE